MPTVTSKLPLLPWTVLTVNSCTHIHTHYCGTNHSSIPSLCTVHLFTSLGIVSNLLMVAIQQTTNPKLSFLLFTLNISCISLMTNIVSIVPLPKLHVMMSSICICCQRPFQPLSWQSPPATSSLRMPLPL